LNALFDHSPDLRLDYVIANSAPIHTELRDKYLADGAVQVGFTARSLCDADLPVEIRIGQSSHVRSLLVLCDNLISEHNVVRHDPRRLAQLLLNIHQRHLTPPLSFSDARLELISLGPRKES
jgi:hypothetical protein